MLIYPVFIPFKGCPYKCIYCQQESITGVNQNDINIDYANIEKYIKNNAELDKQIAFFGGTFTALTYDEQIALLEPIFKYADSKTHLRISTRPDCLKQENIDLLKSYNLRTIELGIQSFDNQVLKASGRNYSDETAESACLLVKNNDLELSIQLMPGLPNDNKDTFLSSVYKCISLKADFVRLYPAIVIKDTMLCDMYKSALYKPWDFDFTLDMLITAVQTLETYNINIIKIGLHTELAHQRDMIVAGPWHDNLGEIIKGIIFMKKILKNYKNQKNVFISKYDASLVLGNNKIVLQYLKNHGFNLPEHFFVDKLLTKGVFCFND